MEAFQMKKLVVFVVLLALLLPAMAMSAQSLLADDAQFSPTHHGTFSCRMSGRTDHNSPYDITIAYWENAQGHITSADVFSLDVWRTIEVQWSYHAFSVNINLREFNSPAGSHICRASARY